MLLKSVTRVRSGANPYALDIFIVARSDRLCTCRLQGHCSRNVFVILPVSIAAGVLVIESLTCSVLPPVSVRTTPPRQQAGDSFGIVVQLSKCPFAP